MQFNVQQHHSTTSYTYLNEPIELDYKNAENECKKCS